MVTPTHLLIALIGFLVIFAVTIALAARYVSRKAAGSLGPKSAPIPVTPPTTLVDPQVIRVLSERLSVLEGRLPAMQATNDGYAALALRVAEMEARLPTISDAYDRFGQMVLNADRRAADRDKRGRNKQQTVEEAAAKMGLAGDPTAPAPDNGTPQLGKRISGVVGSGGSARR